MNEPNPNGQGAPAPTVTRLPPPLPNRTTDDALGLAVAPDPNSQNAKPPTPREGERDGYRVWERIATGAEKFYGTARYVLGSLLDHLELAGRRIFRYVDRVIDLPARLLRLFPWGNHLLTESARSTINMWGGLFTVLGMIKGIFWALTLMYAFEHPLEAIGIASLIVGLDILVERSVAITDRTEGDLIKKPVLGWRDKIATALTMRNALVGFRILAIIVLSIGNAEAIRIRLAREEIEQVLAEDEERINVGLRARRAQEIEAEFARRSAEISAEQSASGQTFTSQRVSARANLVRQRASEAAEKRAEVARRVAAVEHEMRGGFTGQPGDGRETGRLARLHADAQEDLRNHEVETVRILAEFDRETNREQLSREGVLASRRAALNAEKDARLRALRQTSIAQLGAESGVRVTRAHGIWAREDALDRVHAKSAASRRSDWFVQVMLMVIELLGLIVTRNANADTVSYFSLRAHAEARDGTPESRKALELYRSVLARDPSVKEFLIKTFAVYRLLAGYYRAYQAELYELAKAQSTDAHRTRLTQAEVEARVLKAWTDARMDLGMSMLGDLHATAETIRFGLYLLGELASPDDPTLPSLPAWPSYLGWDARQATPYLNRQTLVEYGWIDPTEERTAFEAARQAHFDAQDALKEEIERFYHRFGADVSATDAVAARDVFHNTVRPAVRALDKASRFFTAKGLTLPDWLDQVDPRAEARAIQRRIEIASRQAPEPDGTDPRSERTDDEDERPIPMEDGIRPVGPQQESHGPDRTNTRPGTGFPRLRSIPGGLASTPTPKA